MGGRGGAGTVSSRRIVAFNIDMGGAKSDFVVRKGVVYKENGERVQLSAQQVIQNAKNLGYDVKTYSQKEYDEKQKVYRVDRAATNAFLNMMDAQMGGERRMQRKTTASRRGSKRRK